MSSDELELLTLYLPFNLNVDEAAFRRHLVTNVHTVLTRLRDSSLLQLRRNATAERSAVDVSEAIGQWNFVSYSIHSFHICQTNAVILLLLSAVTVSK